MKIYLCIRPRQRKQMPIFEAMRIGLERHGEDVEMELLGGQDAPPGDYDLIVFWGYNNSGLIKKQSEAGKDFLCMELGYIGNREEWISLGFNGLNNRADFLAENMPSDRWDKCFAGLCKPWKKDGNYILLVGQVSGDMTVKHINFRKWLIETTENIKNMYSQEIIRYRPHPIEVQRQCAKEVPGTIFSTRSLREDLADAKVAVTYNSNAGVDAVLAGVPVVAHDYGAMAWDMAIHTIEQPLKFPDRKQWCYDMAYKQWHIAEIKNGDAWDHLKQRYNQ